MTTLPWNPSRRRVNTTLAAAAMTAGAAATMLVAPSPAAAARVVFLNADAVVINADNGQDPTLNSYSTTGFTAGPISGWPALTDDDKRELVYLMKEATVPFDITYTWERPAAGSYDMIVMGTAADNAALFGGVGCSGAIGLADCDDGNAENVSFLFYGCMDAEDQDNLHSVAHTIFAALGFGWGLENTSVGGQIMGSFFDNGGSVQFGASCTDISGAANCTEHPGCAVGLQNASTDLLGRLGARVDDGMPTLLITEPVNLTVVDSTFTVQAEAEDGFGGLTVELLIVEADVTEQDEEPPYSWTLADVPDGEWTLQVTVTDADANVHTEQVTVCVGTETCPDAGLSDTGGSSTGALDDTGSGDEDASSTGDAAATSTSSSGGDDG
ncbi:MAG: hypothetical protein JKY37_29735, partial [Nannocystaceae bacterium]|nr:hypothetical protein [Nannocystaceae bacterium]